MANTTYAPTFTGAVDVDNHTQFRILENGGRYFRWVKNASADTNAIAGQFACQDNSGTLGECTMKASEVMDGTLGTVTKPLGMWMSAVAFGEYGYILVEGLTDALVTDGGVVGGDYIVMDGGATPTFIADTAVAGEEHAVVGCAPAADTATPTLTVYLNCR